MAHGSTGIFVLMRFCSRIILTISSLVLFLSLHGQDIPLPEGYIIIEKIEGDLDDDGINEMALACNTREAKDIYDDVPKELLILKQGPDSWYIWKRSSQALYSSLGGGVSGDPFGKMVIDSDRLFISHVGGSSWKWAQTDRYILDGNEFYLEVFDSTYGKNCEYWETIHFNLKTGLLQVKVEHESCDLDNVVIDKVENEELTEKGIRISLEKRHELDIKIVTPELKKEIFISQKTF